MPTSRTARWSRPSSGRCWSRRRTPARTCRTQGGPAENPSKDRVSGGTLSPGGAPRSLRMNERDDTNLSAEESISDEISERVRSVISAAESAATAIRHEAEQEVQTKRRAAEEERERYLERAKGESEALLDQRIKRIAELSDSIIEGAESLLMRIGGAQEVKRQLETMVHALAHTAENLAAESEQGRLAPVPRPISADDEAEPRIQAVPEPEQAAPDSGNVTELRVPEP